MKHPTNSKCFFPLSRYTGITADGRRGHLRIYLDLVILLNFLVDYLLMMGSDRLAGYPADWKKYIPAAALGGGYAGACLLPGFSFLGNSFWRIVSFAVIAGVAFGWDRSSIRRGGLFVLLSMALGGLASGIGKGSFPALLIAIGGLWVLCRCCLPGNTGQQAYIPVELNWQGRKLSLIALRDTGNTLRDPITGEQVLVAGGDVATELLGLSNQQLRHPVETIAENWIPGMRLISYCAVGQSGGMLMAMRFHNAKIGNRLTSPLVAFAPDVLAKGASYRMLTGGSI